MRSAKICVVHDLFVADKIKFKLITLSFKALRHLVSPALTRHSLPLFIHLTSNLLNAFYEIGTVVDIGDRMIRKMHKVPALGVYIL